MTQEGQHLSALLPPSIDGWTAARKDQHYDPKNLYEYINGSAELYRSYDFTTMISRTYTRPDEPDMVVDIFDMGSSRNAFGVFTHSRESVERDFGQGSQFYEGYLLFWKGAYLVSILASPETAASKAALPVLARHIEDAIGEDGPLPDALDLLPSEGLVEESLRYFHHYIWQNAHYYLADENLFQINDTTDALLAKYDQGDGRAILLLVRYPEGDDAREAHENFIDVYLRERRDAPVVQIEDGAWTASETWDNILAVVFNAPSEASALDLIEKVQNHNRSR